MNNSHPQHPRPTPTTHNDDDTTTTAMSNGDATHGSTAGGRTFSTLVLGLLTALEADPSRVGKSLHPAQARALEHLGVDPSDKDVPVESNAILTSIARIAERLARAEDAGHAPAPIHYPHDPSAATPMQPPSTLARSTSPHLPPFNYDAISKLISGQPQQQRHGDPSYNGVGTFDASSTSRGPGGVSVGGTSSTNNTPSSAGSVDPPFLPAFSRHSTATTTNTSIFSPSGNNNDSQTTGSSASEQIYVDGQPLSAEMELSLLKSQVQDFARVCKVSTGDRQNGRGPGEYSVCKARVSGCR